MIGQAPPPSSPLSLWYREPAADRPLERIRSDRQAADAEWVRAIPEPGGQGGALRDVRRLLAAGQYREAAALVSQKVMAKPLAQMAYQTLGDLALTFPQAESVDGYRRDLDLATATARVSYTRRAASVSPVRSSRAPRIR
jgi:hypothetical protein